jgi:uncharacterized membrane protein YeaQ/YmgE (transglycosylase-associated protein family)
MEMENWMWFILIGLAAGFLAGMVVKGGGFGLVGNLIVGVIGAVLGGFVFEQLGIHAGGRWGQLFSASVGAIILLVALQFIKSKKT